MVLGFSGRESGIQPQILTKLKKLHFYSSFISDKDFADYPCFGIGGFL